MKLIDNINDKINQHNFKKATEKLSKHNITHEFDVNFDYELKIPGYSGSYGSMRIFVQPRATVDYAGIEADLLLIKADGEQYDDPMFLICGTKFTHMKNELQLAIIEAELMRCDEHVSFDVRSPYDVLEHAGVNGDVGESATAIPDVEVDIYIALSGNFGERIARKVIDRHRKLALKTAKPAAKMEDAYGKLNGDHYSANDIGKANIKKAKRDASELRKRIKPVVKSVRAEVAKDWKNEKAEWKKADKGGDDAKPDIFEEAANQMAAEAAAEDLHSDDDKAARAATEAAAAASDMITDLKNAAGEGEGDGTNEQPETPEDGQK